MIPLINGTGYSWGQIIVNVFNTVITGVTGITYDDTQAIEDNFGAGNHVVERGFGQIETTGSLTLHMSELERLTSIAPDRRLQNIPEFDVIVSYINEQGPVTHTLKNCRFKNNGREPSAGDTAIEKEIELAVGEIKW